MPDKPEPSIRLRAALAVVQQGKILLVPHYHTDAGAVQWVIPGGQVDFCESIYSAACREFQEETGLQAELIDLLDISEVFLPDRPYHSLTITFQGRVTGGALTSEAGHRHGEKTPRWFAAADLQGIAVHPRQAVHKALKVE